MSRDEVVRYLNSRLKAKTTIRQADVLMMSAYATHINRSKNISVIREVLRYYGIQALDVLINCLVKDFSIKTNTVHSGTLESLLGKGELIVKYY